MAATSGSIEAGSAYVRIFAEDGPLRQGLNAAGDRLRSWGEGITIAGAEIFAGGAALVGPLLTAALAFAGAGSQLVDFSQRTGVAIERASSLKFAVEQSAASMTDLESGLQNVQKLLAKSAAGSKEATALFARLGLSAKDLRTLSPDEQLYRISDALARIPDPGQRAAAAMLLMGTAGAKLLPLMMNGAAAIKNLQAEAHKLGLVMSKEDALAAAELGNLLATLWRQLDRIVEIVGAAVTPQLIAMGKIVSGVLLWVTKWIDKNRGLFSVLLTVGLALMGVGAALMIVGGGLAAFGALLSGISALLGFLVPIATAVGSALAAAFAFLVSPIGLTIAAVVALGGAILYWTGAGEEALNALAGYFGELFQTATKAWGGIVDALAAGDLELAGKVAMLGLQVEWQRVITIIRSTWEEFASWFTQVATDTFFGAAIGFNDAAASFDSVWADTTAGMGTAWGDFMGVMEHLWKNTSTFIAEGILALMALFDADLAKNFDARIAEMRAARDTELAQSDSALAEANTKRENERKAKKATIEANRQATSADLANQNQAANAATRKTARENITVSQAALEQAKKDLQAAVDEAKQKRAEFDASLPTGPAGDAAAGLDAAASKFSVVGTFSGQNLGGLGAGSALDKIEENTRETAEALQEIKLGQFGDGQTFDD